MNEQLDSDISLVRELNSTNQNDVTGETACAFNAATAPSFFDNATNTTFVTPVCDIVPTIHIVAEFSDNNDLWLVSLVYNFIMVMTTTFRHHTAKLTNKLFFNPG